MYRKLNSTPTQSPRQCRSKWGSKPAVSTCKDQLASWNSTENFEIDTAPKRNSSTMAGTFSDVAQEDLTCPLCYELFVDPHIPKILDCSHVCCQVCLKRLVKGGKSTIYCPECRQTIHVAMGKITSLKTNLRVRSLAEKHLQLGNATAQKLQRRMTITCSNHDGEKMYFHCITCNVPICQFCLLHSHKEHDVREQKAVVQDKKDEMERNMREAIDDVKSYEARVQGLTELERQIEQALKQEEAEIDACAERIRKKCQDLKLELRQAEEERLETIRQEKERLGVQSKNIRTHHAHVENNIDTMTDYDYIMAHEDFLTKMKALTVKEKGADIYMKPSVSKFVAMPGEIKLGWFSKPKHIDPDQEFGEFESASGIVCTPQGYLTVSDFGNNQVSVYSEQESEFKKLMLLTLSSANQCMPVDVASTPDSKFLVVRGSGIEVYSIKGKYKRKIGTASLEGGETTSNTVDVCSVTTTRDGRILAADYGKSAITVHDPMGRIVKTITTSVKPQCLAAIHDSHVIMSDFHSGKVCIIDLETAEETLNVDIPEAQGVCYDEQTDCILVVRNERGSEPGRVFIGTGVIEQYCRTTGRLIACLAQDLYHPRALAFTNDGRLAVADSKTIKVYKNI